MALFPNALVSLHPDYVMLHTLWPREPGLTDVICEFFFEPATIDSPDFDPSDAVGFWNQVNGEDWHVCELAQKGAASRGYTAGRYSAAEGDSTPSTRWSPPATGRAARGGDGVSAERAK